MINDVRLRKINNGLFGIVVMLVLYMVSVPVLPALQWWAKHDAPVISSPRVTRVEVPAAAAVPAENTLVVPSLNLSESIFDGKSPNVLEKGIWHRPGTSTPDAGSNTVLAGHRFTYNNKVFYHLDKVQLKDQIIVYWQGKVYEYEVSNIKVVPPTEVSVEASTDDAMLTMYTCTPLVTGKDRLIIQAKLIKKGQ